MPTPQACRARAEEVERLASIVSYGRDRERLTRQAHELRARAEALEAEPPSEACEAQPSLVDRLRGGLRRLTA